MPADYHTHTPLCHHAEGTPEEYIDAAINAGLTEYGISCHAPQTPEPFDDWRMSLDDLPAYLDWIARAHEHAAGRIPVRAGLELDWLPNNESQLETLSNYHDWDYLIGSVHYLPAQGQNHWDFDNPAHLSQWSAFSEAELEELWTHYWKTFSNMASSGFFDILAHPDLIKKFRSAPQTPQGDLNRFYEPAIEAIAENGSTIEINTAGWHKPCAEQYPTKPFLELAASAGIPLVISSDAHHPNEVAQDFSKAIDLAKSCGFTHSSLFQKRQRSSLPLS